MTSTVTLVRLLHSSKHKEPNYLMVAGTVGTKLSEGYDPSVVDVLIRIGLPEPLNLIKQ